MKIKFTLQLQLLLTVALVIILALSGFTYLSINSQREFYYDSFRDSAIALVQALDASIGSKAELSDVNKLQSNIYKIMWLNPNITKISISLPTEDGLKVVASNDTALVGNMATSESISSYQEGVILTRIFTEPNGTQSLKVITPVHVGGQRVGTYDIRLSLESLEQTIYEIQKQFLIGAIIIVLLIVGILFILIRITVINPVKDIQKGMKIIGQGQLDYKIKIKRKNEIGDLASGFNQMTEKLKDRTNALTKEKASLERKVGERTKELEEIKTVLEIKVKARTYELEMLTKSLEEKVKERTEELQERMEELERFQKLAVGRELKMINLKEEIKKLKKGNNQKQRSKIKK